MKSGVGQSLPIFLGLNALEQLQANFSKCSSWKTKGGRIMPEEMAQFIKIAHIYEI